LLVWASAWVKWARPDVFCCALLNSQPMGFYQPAQLVRDAREHGVEVRPPDVLFSEWNCTLDGDESDASARVDLQNTKTTKITKAWEMVTTSAKPTVPSWSSCSNRDAPSARIGPEHYRPLRLGLRQIKGLKEAEAQLIVSAREARARTFEDFALGSGVTRRTLERLARPAAFRSLGLGRPQALWAVKGLSGEIGAQKQAPLLIGARPREA